MRLDNGLLADGTKAMTTQFFINFLTNFITLEMQVLFNTQLAFNAETNICADSTFI